MVETKKDYFEIYNSNFVLHCSEFQIIKHRKYILLKPIGLKCSSLISIYQCFGGPGSFYIVAPRSPTMSLRCASSQQKQTARLEEKHPSLLQLPLAVREAQKLVSQCAQDEERMYFGDRVTCFYFLEINPLQ